MSSISRKKNELTRLTDADMAAIRDYASRSLTYYMMPKFTVVVDSFPQTANGKLDRKALPNPPELMVASAQSVQSVQSVSLVAPTTPLPGTPGVHTGDTGMVVKRNFSIQDIEEGRVSPGLTNSVEVAKRKLEYKRITMTSHICDIVERLRGVRPGPHTTFAALGVDSLGAVMFVRQLSESLGGLRVKPADLFTPGVTVKQYAVGIRKTLLRDKPVLLQTLGISDGDVDEDENKEESGAERGDDSKAVDGKVVLDYCPSAVESSFDDLIVSNIPFLDGVRGILTFMVLIDHFPAMNTNKAIVTDTLLFVILSGFTTALQLRVPPRYATRTADGVVILLPRKRFDIWGYIETRMVGIYPILWFTLVLFIPQWYLDDEKHHWSSSCAILYDVGMQAWNIQECAIAGPHDVFYASLILNLFIMYAIIRFVFSELQNFVLFFRDETRTLPHSNAGDSTVSPRTSLQRLGNFVTSLCYNRASFATASLMTLFWLCFTLAGFNWCRVNRKKYMEPGMYLPYFLSGVSAASIVEMWHFALRGGMAPGKIIDGNIQLTAIGAVKPASGAVVVNGEFSVNNDDDHEDNPFLANISDDGPVLVRSDDICVRLARAAFEMGFTSDVVDSRNQEFKDKKSPPPPFNLISIISKLFCGFFLFFGCAIEIAISALQNSGHLIWRFLPDKFCVVFALLILQGEGLLDRVDIVFDLTWIWLPLLFLAYMCVSIMQEGPERLNVSRFLLERPRIGILGYCSYSCFLLQRILIEYYVPFAMYSVQQGEFGCPHMEDHTCPKGRRWFLSMPLYARFIIVLLVILVSWVVQCYFQDTLVVYWYGKFLDLRAYYCTCCSWFSTKKSVEKRVA